MEEIVENLWICPVCSAEHATPVIVCCRCGCQILLLNKIKLIALSLSRAGNKNLAKLFYDKEGCN